jgi:DNA-binding Lrp family transcriptional regulator
MREKELQLLEYLEQDSSLPIDVLAKMVNLSEEETKGLIEKLEKERVIVQYTALINWNNMKEKEHLTAMIDVKVTPKQGVGFDAIAEKIYRYSEVKAVYLMSGTYDLSVVVEGRTMSEVASFVSQKLSTLDSVISTTTHFVLKKYKHDGIVYEQNDDDNRMMVTP